MGNGFKNAIVGISFKTAVLNYVVNQGCSYTEFVRGPMPPPPLQFLNTTRSKIPVSNIRDIAFYGCSEIIRARNFTIFIMYDTIVGQFMVRFHFFLPRRRNRSLYFGPSGKVRYLTLDLPKSFFLWIIRKKTTMNEILNLRL